jgi:hypothetical protein
MYLRIYTYDYICIGKLVITVNDTGVGISEINQKKLFDQIVQFNPEVLQVSMNKNIYMYIYMYIYICKCLHICIYIYVNMYICICVYIYIYIYIYLLFLYLHVRRGGVAVWVYGLARA